MPLRETLEQAGYRLVSIHNDEAIVEYIDTGKWEVWFKHDDNPSYTLVINDVGYEFVRSLP